MGLLEYKQPMYFYDSEKFLELILQNHGNEFGFQGFPTLM